MKDLIGKCIWVDEGCLSHIRIVEMQVTRATDKQAFARTHPSAREVRLLLSEHGSKWWDCEEHALITAIQFLTPMAVQLQQQAVDKLREVERVAERLRQLNLHRRHPDA